MDLSCRVRNVLKEDVLLELPRGGSTVVLDEPDPQSGMKVTVSGVSDAIAVVRMGGQSRMNHLAALRSGQPWSVICDYLLIARVHDVHYAVFIELKKTLHGDPKPREQLRRSRPLLDYLLSVCDVEYGRASRKPKIGYVLIGEKINQRFDKQAVRGHPSGKVGEEPYHLIKIMTFLGPRVTLADLTSH